MLSDLIISDFSIFNCKMQYIEKYLFNHILPWFFPGINKTNLILLTEPLLWWVSVIKLCTPRVTTTRKQRSTLIAQHAPRLCFTIPRWHWYHCRGLSGELKLIISTRRKRPLVPRFLCKCWHGGRVTDWMFCVRPGTVQVIAQIRGADTRGYSLRLNLLQWTFGSGSHGVVNTSEQDTRWKTFTDHSWNKQFVSLTGSKYGIT